MFIECHTPYPHGGEMERLPLTWNNKQTNKKFPEKITYKDLGMCAGREAFFPPPVSLEANLLTCPVVLELGQREAGGALWVDHWGTALCPPPVVLGCSPVQRMEPIGLKTGHWSEMRSGPMALAFRDHGKRSMVGQRSDNHKNLNQVSTRRCGWFCRRWLGEMYGLLQLSVAAFLVFWPDSWATPGVFAICTQ